MTKEFRIRYVPDDFHRKVKGLAATQGKTIKQVVMALLKKWLEEHDIEVE